jgi:ATP-binding protein involved in chromosome partitioning
MSDSTCSTCNNEDCSAKVKNANESDIEYVARKQIFQRMCKIKHKILVISGKGGVGKSTVAVNMAEGLAMSGAKVGLIDADIHGPSIPKMLNVVNSDLVGGPNNTIQPVECNGNLKVISIGFFLKSQDDALILRGPKKYGLIQQFMKDVEWGELDYLIFDLPPGTGDEALSICQLIDKPDGAVIVTTPQGVAITDVRKSITFCRQLKLPILGVIENMSGFICPKCGDVTHIFDKGGAVKMTTDMEIPFLGEIPIDPQIAKNGDMGTPFVSQDDGSSVSAEFMKIIKKISTKLNK